jgi:putative DNA primase/helicase
MPQNDDDRARSVAASILAQVNQPHKTLTEPSKPTYIYEITNDKTHVTTVFINYPLYADFLKHHFSIVYFNKTIFIYDDGNHFYRKQTNEIETHIRDTVVQWNVSGKLVSILNEMMAHITSMGCYMEYPFNMSRDTIPVENGIVKLDYDKGTISLLPHGNSHLFTYKLSVIYKPEIRNCFAIQLLKRMVEPALIKTLIQIPAQALLQMQTGHAYKKAYLLQGEPHAGKTSYLKLLYQIFGDDFTTAISLQHLCEDRFVGGNLEGKLLNIYDDLEDVALDVIDQFKTLTGDCRHGVERKYEPVYTGRVTAVHIFTCNYPPEYPEKVKRDAAFWTRWEYVKFPFEYSVNPNFYTDWYTQERMSSFFNLILAAMIYIKKRGLLSNSDIQEVMSEWTINSDPIFDFINYIFTPSSTKTINHYSKTGLYTLYVNWCNENKIPPHKQKLTIKSFTIALQAHHILPDRKRSGGISYETYSTTEFVSRPDYSVVLLYTENYSFRAT